MTHHVSDFAASLVEMARAMERLPIAELELSEARQEITAKYDTIQRLELKLIDRARQIDALNSRIHDLEVARDDAELRFLECDDAKATLERALEAIMGEGRAVLAAIRPLPEPNAVSEVKLVDAPLLPVAPSNPEASTDSSQTALSVGVGAAAQGQSAADPTSAPTHSSSESEGSTAASTAASPSTESPAGPFASPADTASIDQSSGIVGESAANPTTLGENTGGGNHEGEAHSDGPFATGTTPQPQPAPTGAAGNTTAVSLTPRPTEDSEWPWFSQASHQSA